ncbi:MAG: hypothetical protein QG551_192 [Patescibacteria group bacterium]|jgi:hypothetical protein|nr:hypothetical protein [Patescibacteria group bacterium]
MRANSLFQDLTLLYNLGVSPEGKKVALTQRQMEEAEAIFCRMVNQRPFGLRAGISDANPAFSHKLLSLVLCQNERRVSQLVMAFGNAISKKSRAEKTDIAMAILEAKRNFPHLREHPNVLKLVNHLMSLTNTRIAA